MLSTTDSMIVKGGLGPAARANVKRSEPYSIYEDMKDFLPTWDLALNGYLNYLGDTDDPNRPRAKFALTPKAEDYLEDMKEIPE